MKTILLIYASLCFCFNNYCQEPTKKNFDSFTDFINDQNNNISKLVIGSNIEETKNIMGASIIVSVPETGKIKELNQLFKQPEFVNKYKSNPAFIIDILWYFSTPKDQNGIISKSECTPVIFENDSLVGKGWPFFQTFRRTGKMR